MNTRHQKGETEKVVSLARCFLIKIIVGSIFVFCLPYSVEGKVFYKKEQALKIAFPDATAIERKTVFLSSKQTKEIQNLSETDVHSKMIIYYIGKRDDIILGYCFFETRIVKRKPSTLMIVLTPSGKINMIEVLAFYEPSIYLPKKAWLNLFHNKSLKDSLHIKKGIKNISGATLTADFVAKSARFVIAVFKVAIYSQGGLDK